MSARAAVPHREEVKRTLARNTVWNYLGFIVNLVTNLALFPFVVHRVGESAAGIWLLLGSLTGYMGLLELGIVPALTQHVASSLARGEHEEVNRATSTALAVLVVMMVVALQGLWFVPILVGVLTVPAGLERDAVLIFSIAIAGFALKMPLAASQALLLGCQRQDRCSQLWIVLACMKAAATVAVLLLGRGIVAVVLVEALSYLLSAPFQLRWVRAEVPNLHVSWRLVDGDRARSLVGFGGTLLALSVCSLIIQNTDRLVIGAFRPIADVTQYSAAWKLYWFAHTVPLIVLHAVSPLAASFFGRSDTDGLRRLFLAMTKYSTAIALPLTVSLALSAGTLLRLWMGPAFVDARTVVQVLAGAFIITAFNHAGYSILTGTRRIAPTLWLYFFPQAALNLLLSLWLIRPLGIVGVALGTAIPAVLLEYPYLRFLLGAIGVDWRTFGRNVVVPTAVPALVAFAPLLVAFLAVGPTSLVLPALAACCSAAYAALFWGRSLSASERRGLIELVRRRVPPPAAAALNG